MSQSDPLRAPNHTPRRAEPLQPDRPARGDEKLQSRDSPKSSSESVDKQLEQSKTALDNVRNP